MNRFIQYFNFAGVLALAAICASQWRTNRDLNLQVIRQEKARLEQSTKIEEQLSQLRGCSADLDHFREQLAALNATSRQAQDRHRAAERELEQLRDDRAQLQSSITNWAKAVTARDERLGEAAEQIRKLAAERNETASKFNEVAAKYNAVVSDLNTRTRDFNAIVEKYNALVKEAKRN